MKKIILSSINWFICFVSVFAIGIVTDFNYIAMIINGISLLLCEIIGLMHTDI